MRWRGGPRVRRRQTRELRVRKRSVAGEGQTRPIHRGSGGGDARESFPADLRRPRKAEKVQVTMIATRRGFGGVILVAASYLDRQARVTDNPLRVMVWPELAREPRRAGCWKSSLRSQG